MHFNQHDKSPVMPVSFGWWASLSHLCKDLRNSSELKLPSRFVSKTWNMTSTTISETAIPQTYHHTRDNVINLIHDLTIMHKRIEIWGQKTLEGIWTSWFMQVVPTPLTPTTSTHTHNKKKKKTAWTLTQDTQNWSWTWTSQTILLVIHIYLYLFTCMHIIYLYTQLLHIYLQLHT